MGVRLENGVVVVSQLGKVVLLEVGPVDGPPFLGEVVVRGSALVLMRTLSVRVAGKVSVTDASLI